MDKKAKAMVQGVLAFPLPVMVVIPGLLLYFTQGFRVGWGSEGLSFWLPVLLGAVLIVAGIFLALKTIFLFYGPGDGTPVPWEPPKNFVVLGPYRYVRNPMMWGVLAILAGEGVLFGSSAILVWLIVFLLAMNLFVLFYEEPGLEKRFGEDYRRYKQHVPRWIPRLTPYQKQ